MAHKVVLLGALLAVMAAGLAVSRADDEAKVQDADAAKWLEILKNKKVKVLDRRNAVFALGILGPKVPEVIPALSEALQHDTAAEIRWNIAHKFPARRLRGLCALTK